MTVLAQIFDVMLPDRKTLLSEVCGDKEGLVKIFEARSKKDMEKAELERTLANQARESSHDNLEASGDNAANLSSAQRLDQA